MTLLDEYYAVKAARNGYQRHPLDDGNAILNPLETEIRMQVMIRDSEYLAEPNDYGEYQLEFLPVSSYDYSKLESKIEEVSSHWYRTKGYMIDIEPYNHIATKYGEYKCNQLFSPKLNLTEPDNPYFPKNLGMEARKADLCLHFRDAPDGQIYLQCSYCDLFEPDEIEPAEPSEYDPNEPDW